MLPLLSAACSADFGPTPELVAAPAGRGNFGVTTPEGVTPTRADQLARLGCRQQARPQLVEVVDDVRVYRCIPRPGSARGG